MIGEIVFPLVIRLLVKPFHFCLIFRKRISSHKKLDQIFRSKGIRCLRIFSASERME